MVVAHRGAKSNGIGEFVLPARQDVNVSNKT
jgi:hypothetical protein